MSPDVLGTETALVLAWPAGLRFLWLLPLFAVALWLSGRSRRVSVALGLRAAAFVLVVLAVAGLSIERREAGEGLCIVVSADVSESVGRSGAEARDRLVADLVARLGPEDRLGAVVFARRAEVVAWPDAPPKAAPFGAPVDPSATRLDAGIEAAVPLCPDGGSRKIVLVTDGNQTLGDARRGAVFAREAGARVYAVVPGLGDEHRVLVEKLVAPPVVREGGAFPVRAMVRSGFADPTVATLRVAVDGESALTGTVRLDPGLNVLEVPYQLAERGTHRLSAVVSAADSEDRRELSLSVAGPVRALLVGDDPDTPLAGALRQKKIEVDVRPAKSFPALEALLEYHCVILDDVPRKALADAALADLETYVKSYGGGFVMTGGARAFGDRAYQKSAVERILPVSLVEQPPKGRGRSAMGVFLVIDRSNSMGYNSRRRDVRDSEKMSYAKQAALALVQQLRPEDRVGVIAFDSDPYVLGPLRPLSEHRADLEDRISRLTPGGGTDFKAALEIAVAQLVAAKLRVMHVILLTDGDTNRGVRDHDLLIRTMSRLGISVTTIRIGDDEVNLEFLREISRQTAGRFHHVTDIERLPQLVVNDTRQAEAKLEAEEGGQAAEEAAKAAAAAEAAAEPQIGEQTDVVRGIAEGDFPPLHDVPQTELKNGAEQVLFVAEGPRKRTVLATWQYGLGRVAALPFDPGEADARAWIAWSGFSKLWSQLVRWAMREETPWETQHAVRHEDGKAYLELQTFDAREDGGLRAELMVRPDERVELSLVPVAPRRYRAPLPALAPGRYPLLLRRGDGEAAGGTKREIVTIEDVPGEGAEPELARRLPDIDLLREVTAQTGGSVNPTIDELVARAPSTAVRRDGLGWLLLPLALALVLGDIALRRRFET